ncbi:hypothetical protein GRB29_06485 [Streptococcus pneumoniae]|nr:hypothetical protein [Streptococcus pneumoniae]
MVNTSQFSSKENFIRHFFESKFNDRELAIFLQIMFIEPSDYYIHHTDYTEYIYNNSAKIAQQLQNQEEFFYKQNIERLEKYISELETKEPDLFTEVGDNYRALQEIPQRLNEHIRLARLQYDTFFSEVEKSKDLKARLIESEKALKAASQKIDDSSNNMISLLGIFSSFIFLLFGGFQALSKIIEVSLKTSVSFNEILFVACVLIFFMFTIIYFMLYWIGKMTGRSIVDLNCDCKVGGEVKTCHNWRHTLKRHASYLIIAIPTLITALVSFLAYSKTVIPYFFMIVISVICSIFVQFILSKKSQK